MAEWICIMCGSLTVQITDPPSDIYLLTDINLWLEDRFSGVKLTDSFTSSVLMLKRDISVAMSPADVLKRVSVYLEDRLTPSTLDRTTIMLVPKCFYYQTKKYGRR